MTSLKTKTVNGLTWSAIDSFSSSGMRFIIGVIIARILAPSDYGLIGMIAIFLGLSEVFIGAGFGVALIRKTDRTEDDISTVFYFNIVASIIIYVGIYVAAPSIANFYDTPQLLKITRVVSLGIIIGAFGTIQRTLLTIKINFKAQTKITILSLIISGSIGITLAYLGYGVWALAYQGLASSFLTTFFLWYFSNWKPKWVFSLNSFKELFGFSSKIMGTELLTSIFENIYEVVIGKLYSANELGFYSRAKGLVRLPSSSLTAVIQRVTFPVLSEIQNDHIRLVKNYQKLLKMLAFIMFPLMVLLGALGEPLIKLLLTEKWLPSVVLLQVLCFSYMFQPFSSINLNLLAVKGRSDLILKLEFVSKFLIVIVLFVSAPFGVFVMCLGTLISTILSFLIITNFTGKYIDLSTFKQLKLLAPCFMTAVLAGAVALVPSFFTNNPLYQLLIGAIMGSLIYLGIARFLKFEELSEIWNLISEKVKLLNKDE
ncbi:lipopolysaccharide biosynthesis protein [Saccharicrinis sp. FJH54]|uniref:lipopolysaccharide biosynthesis protein n=1 Tax=Saccharicrinis sp. FJH54 TaxID=3344665 RepID=UPI0035D4B27A